MSSTYQPYYIPKTSDEGIFTRLIYAQTDIQASDLRDIRRICATLNDDHTQRIMNLEKWGFNLGPAKWRARTSCWNAREAKYVIECLRWEYVQMNYIFQLNREFGQISLEACLPSAMADEDTEIHESA